MRVSQHYHLFVTAVLIGSLFIAWPGASQDAEGEVLVCPTMHAKAMPKDLKVEAMAFTGPAGDGRRGSAGIVVPTAKLIDGEGTRLAFTFERDVTGFHFQVIHPFQKGHVLVSLHSGLTIHRGGSWGDIGWGNPANSDKVALTDDGAESLPLKENTPYKVVSQLSAKGEYELWIDDKLICRHTVEKAAPLVLEVPKKESVWLGSEWDRTPFAGDGFKPELKPNDAGLILGPMDGAAPRQNFRQIKLSAAK